MHYSFLSFTFIFHIDTDVIVPSIYSIELILLKWHEGMSLLTLILTMAGAPCTYLGHNKASCGAMRNCIDSSTSWKFSLAAGTSGSGNQDCSCFHEPQLSSEPTVCPSGDWTLSDVCLKVSEAGWKNFWHFLPSNNFLSQKNIFWPHIRKCTMGLDGFQVPSISAWSHSAEVLELCLVWLKAAPHLRPWMETVHNGRNLRLRNCNFHQGTPRQGQKEHPFAN